MTGRWFVVSADLRDTRPRMRLRLATATGVALLALALALPSGSALAQIKQPGAHPHYETEVEPHLFLQWDNAGWWDDEGIGVGVRITIPLVHNGPIDSINNNMGVGFGFDWAHFGDACYLGVDLRWLRGWGYGD